MSKYKIIGFMIGALSLASTVGAATLSISPASGTYSSGGTFTVNVVLDTTGAQIDGVDLRYLNFNPNVLQVVDSNGGQSGVQVAPGTLMPSTLSNTVDNSNGRITFSQIVAGGQHYSGSGTLLTITFQAVSGGTGTLTFDAASGATTDSNVASNGADVLTSATGATFSISGAVTNPTPSPTPTPSASGAGASGAVTPTPSSGGAVSPTPSTTTTSCSAGPSLPKTIYIGAKGSDVTTLQNYLIQNGYLAAGNNSGYFGQLTRSAVQKFQCAKGISCSGSESTTGYGLVGARTRATLAGSCVGTVTPPSSGSTTLGLSRTVMMGARGNDIISLQNILISKGYLSAGNNSGYFGSLTRAAVQKFQCEKMQICSGSESTTGYGLVGARTRAALSQ